MARERRRSAKGRTVGTGAVLAATVLLALGVAGLAHAGADLPLVVSITVSSDPVDAGFPLELTAEATPFDGSLEYSWVDSDGATATGAVWDVAIATPGPVTFQVNVLASDGLTVTGSVTVVVVPAPQIALAASGSQADAGLPFAFDFNLTGGVPPFQGTWTAEGSGSVVNVSWPADGVYPALAVFPDPGPAWVSVELADATGDPVVATLELPEVGLSLAVGLEATPSVAEVGHPATVVAMLERGALPIRWSFGSSEPFAGGVPPSGTADADGAVDWNATFVEPGPASVNLTAEDADGAYATANVSVAVVASVSVNLTGPVVGPDGAWSVTAAVAGGVPPYAYRFSLSDGERAVGNLSADGPTSVTFYPAAAGTYRLSVNVTDGLGIVSGASETARWTGAPVPTPSVGSTAAPLDAGTAAVDAVAVLAGLVVLVGGLLWWRRRSRREEAPAERPALATVRKVLGRAGHLDRETLELLCEEEGEPRAAVDAALGILVRSGEVTREPGPGPEETFVWSAAERADGSREAAP